MEDNSEEFYNELNKVFKEMADENQDFAQGLERSAYKIKQYSIHYLQKNHYAPHIQGEHIYFYYRGYRFFLEWISMCSFRLTIPDIANVEKKNKAVVSRFIIESRTFFSPLVKIDNSNNVYMYCETNVSNEEDFNTWFNCLLKELMIETHSRFMSKMNKWYGIDKEQAQDRKDNLKVQQLINSI